MKITKPVIKTIRFDTNLNLIGNRKGITNQLECDGYCLDGLDQFGKKVFAIGIRIRLNFYIDKIENEVVGYLSETESIIIVHTNALEDMQVLIRFAASVYRNIKHNLQNSLPEIDLTVLEFGDPNAMAYYLSGGLIQLGFYN